jgi:N-acetylneuraminic acid mutarotase
MSGLGSKMTLRYVGLASLTLIAGCGGGGSGQTSTPTQGNQGVQPGPAPSISVAGAVQKGPFLVGSTVLVNKLDSLGRPTDSTIVTEVEDSVGGFSFSTTSSGPVQIVASGYYFSELTGQVSSGTLTLRAVYDVSSASSQTAYVNIMTHLINDRVLALIANERLSVANAISRSEREFLSAFSAALAVDDVDQFAGLSIYNTAASANDAGNAYLLALSTGFYKYSTTKAQQFGTAPDPELTLILNRIREDFAADGTVETSGFINEFTRAIRSLSPVEIAHNLRNRSIADYPSGLDVPDISRFLNQCAGTAECAWRSGAPMPQPTRTHATAQFGGKLYVFGGVSSVADVTQAVRVYDPVANTWTSKGQMPVAMTSGSAHTVGNKIYVLPTYNHGFLNQVLEYDPVNDTWTSKTPSPTHRYETATEVLNGRIYVAGGHGTIDDGPWAPGKPWAFKAHVGVYDPATDTWTTAQSLPIPIAGAASCVAGAQLYVFGGRTGPGSLLDGAWVYNPTADSWSAKSPLSSAREGHSCVEVGDEFYMLGGLMGNSVVLDAVDRYDPATDTWQSPTRMPTGRYWLGAEAIGGEIFIVGGQTLPTMNSDGRLDVVEILNPLP